MRNFNEWFSTFTDTIATWKYYTDFDKVYANTNKIKRVEATRMINCNSEARGKIKELLISNF